jgi:hypothetical protein
MITPAPWRAAVALAVLGGVAITVADVSPAAAHVAIRLDIRSPAPDATVDSNVSVIVVAQPTLAGVDHVAFTAALDGRPVDPRTGRRVTETRPMKIPASSSRTIPLRNLPSGRHEITLRYRPDLDEQPSVASVRFTVRRAAGQGRLVGIVAGTATLLGAGAVGLRLHARRRQRSR